MKLAKILGFGGLLIAFGPLGIALLSFPLSHIFGCIESGANPPICDIGGQTMGEVLWMMAMLHWFTLVTFLPGIALSLIGLVVAVVSKVRSKRNKSGAVDS